MALCCFPIVQSLEHNHYLIVFLSSPKTKNNENQVGVILYSGFSHSGSAHYCIPLASIFNICHRRHSLPISTFKYSIHSLPVVTDFSFFACIKSYCDKHVYNVVFNWFIFLSWDKIPKLAGTLYREGWSWTWSKPSASASHVWVIGVQLSLGSSTLLWKRVEADSMVYSSACKIFFF